MIDANNTVINNPNYSDNYKLDLIIQNDQLVSAAIEATNNAPEDQLFEVRATIPIGAKAIQKDDEGIPQVSDTVLVATFDNKSDAKEFAATLNKAIDGDEEAIREVGKWETNFNSDYEADIRTLTAAVVQPFTMSNSRLGGSLGSFGDSLVDFGNSSLLENLLTQNSPTINIPMVMEEVCEMILVDDPIDIFSKKNVWKKLVKKIDEAVGNLIWKVYKQIKDLLIKIFMNIVQALRKMIAAKIKQFLAEYVADACLSGLQTAIAEFENPTNLLDMEELLDSLSDALNSLDHAVGKIIDEIKTAFVQPIIVFFTEGCSGDNKAAYWQKQLNKVIAYLNRAICGRTKAFAELAQNGLTSSFEEEIKNFMQGCLFQQALKSAKNFAPDAIPTDIMNRISNLTQKGQMMDAYNVALAAGVDLRSENFRIELPYAGGWVNEIYGDPYQFTTEKFNPSQTAKWVVEGLPTASEMMNGEIPPEKMQNSWVAENWTEENAKSMALLNNLDEKIDANEESIEGAEKIGEELSYAAAQSDGSSGVIYSDIITPITKSQDRNA